MVNYYNDLSQNNVEDLRDVCKIWAIFENSADPK